MLRFHKVEGPVMLGLNERGPPPPPSLPLLLLLLRLSGLPSLIKWSVSVTADHLPRLTSVCQITSGPIFSDFFFFFLNDDAAMQLERQSNLYFLLICLSEKQSRGEYVNENHPQWDHLPRNIQGGTLIMRDKNPALMCSRWEDGEDEIHLFFLFSFWLLFQHFRVKDGERRIVTDLFSS